MRAPKGVSTVDRRSASSTSSARRTGARLGASLRLKVRIWRTRSRARLPAFSISRRLGRAAKVMRPTWTAAVQMGWDWCDKGADIEFRTNEEPPFLNKAIINHALPMAVDGEPALQWIAARFNGEPTASNCGHFP
mgnify:CR=1 FL=1